MTRTKSGNTRLCVFHKFSIHFQHTFICDINERINVRVENGTRDAMVYLYMNEPRKTGLDKLSECQKIEFVKTPRLELSKETLQVLEVLDIVWDKLNGPVEIVKV